MVLQGKKALIFGVANQRSIAYGVAKAYHEQGARLGFSYAGEKLLKRITPVCEELQGDFIVPCDVSEDTAIAEMAATVAEKWPDGIDILIHSVAFANREDLQHRYVDTSRAGFHLAMDISVYSLVGLVQALESQLNPGASVLSMTYLGSQRVIRNYNIMGIAKAALEASVRYLAADMGQKGVRVNAISAGPLKTLAASGVADFNSLLKPFTERAPLRRAVTLDDVAGAAVYLGSDLGSGTTGEVLYVDCGFNIMGL